MADIEKLVQVISEEIARQLVQENGKRVSGAVISLHVAESFEALNDMDVDDFYRLIRGYVDSADVHVSIPTWQIKQDGTRKTDQELEEELKF